MFTPFLVCLNYLHPFNFLEKVKESGFVGDLEEPAVSVDGGVLERSKTAAGVWLVSKADNLTLALRTGAIQEKCLQNLFHFRTKAYSSDFDILYIETLAIAIYLFYHQIWFYILELRIGFECSLAIFTMSRCFDKRR